MFLTASLHRSFLKNVILGKPEILKISFDSNFLKVNKNIGKDVIK